MIYTDDDGTIEIDGSRYKVLAEEGEGGYDWSVIGLFEDEIGRRFIGADSGCSCNSFADYGLPNTWEPVSNLTEAMDKSRSWFGGYSSSGNGLAFAEKLHKAFA